ncbi:spore coat protein [Streptomyces spiroverticillatus]|uniref:Spore coat protein n=1 Tax=Streptomyces finlayi TaxID=67296 RepID=A0A918XAK8_9ACTN|nr:GNAT family N-acetyltransferase [Streptomyces finlayi]GHA50947.1 spore coat protein [Streptomyces spiroverticillatus]GHD20038.1 spore coat protein [Streptomyces finlayi]
MNHPLTFTPADEDLWDQYDRLATRSYGHRVTDITDLRPHADLQVAVRDGNVVAGGLGLLIDHYFGGAPVPSAALGAGCVAPEERGEHLAARMVEARLKPLREQGAVISTLSTSSNHHARLLGWQAPVTVLAWTVTTEDLHRAFDERKHTAYDITCGLTPEARQLQQHLARQWNGPVHRPAWWDKWKTDKSDLTTYRFALPDQPITGYLSLATKRRPHHGMTLTVHDFWAADAPTTAAMYAFLGRHHTRAPDITFRRGALPPDTTLLHHLHRFRPTAQAWHPWMLRLLDLPGAIQRRGWPEDLDATVPIEIESEDRLSHGRYLLRLTAGSAELTTTHRAGDVALTRGQLAVWYAGGYRTTTAARAAGVRATSPRALTTLIRATTGQEPWLPDHF